MKHRIEAHGLFAAGRLLLAIAATLLAAACSTSSSIDELAPSAQAAATTPLPAPTPPGGAVGADEPPSVAESALLPVEGRPAPPPTGAARDTGEFPNLNVTPGAAAAQLTPDEKAASLSQLKARQQRQAAIAEKLKPANDQERLRQLGATHGADALRTIEESN